MAKKKFSVLVFLDCLEEYSEKKKIASVTFLPRNCALKSRIGHAQWRWPGVTRSGSRKGIDITSGIVDSSI